jgi:aspartyl/glutamyl-tRNA(Asn/Gln) amidotransferase C subunit
LKPDIIDIRYVAKLARIALTGEEIAVFGRQLGDLLGHVNALARLDIESVPATAQVVESRARFGGSAAAPGWILPSAAHHRGVVQSPCS